jgi:hypothetical protein
MYNTYRHTFTVPPTGTYNLVVWGGFISSQYCRIYIDDFLVELANVPLTVSLTSPSNGSGSTLGYPVAVSANATDADGTVSSLEFFANGNSIGTDNTAPFSVNWNPSATGSYSITARATDNLGAQTTSSANSITINANTAPSVSLTGPSGGSSFLRNATVSISANASDAEGSVSLVEFFVNGKKVGEDASSSFSFDWTATGLGNQIIAVSAIDDLGLTSAQQTVNITTTNNLPSASISAPVANASFFRGTSVSISANATDVDGSVSLVEFFVNGNKVGEYTSAPFAFNWTATGLGNQSLTVVATDNDGGIVRSSAVSFTVNNNAPGPSLTSPAANASFARGNSITLFANAADADGSISLVEFFVNGSKIGEDNWAPYSISWTAAGALGNQTLTTLATDNDGASTTSSGVSISLINLNHAISLDLPVNGSNFVQNEAVAFSATARNAECSIAKVEFFVIGSKVEEDLGVPYQFSWLAANISLNGKCPK